MATLRPREAEAANTTLTEEVAAFHAEEDRAITVHRAGQMTIADYYRLDKVDAHEITGTYRVRTRPFGEVHEYLLHTAAGWLVRAEFEAARCAASCSSRCRTMRMVTGRPFAR